MTIERRIKTLLDETLHLRGRSSSWTLQTPLLGSLPELDSLAVVGVISAIEKEFRFHVEDDEIKADILSSVGALAAFIARKLGRTDSPA